MLLLAAPACSNSEADPAGGDEVALPVAPGLDTSSNVVDETNVIASDDLREPPAAFYGAMHTVKTQDGGGTLPTRRNAAAAIAALDGEGNVVGRAVAVKLEGFPNSEDALVVDSTSTAFTRLATMPPFMTDNPLALIILRGAAQESPNLARLASAIEKNAQTNPRFDAEPTAAEARALGALARDVDETLTQTAAQLPGARAAGVNRVAPAWATQTMSVAGPSRTVPLSLPSRLPGAALAMEDDCLAVIGDDGDLEPGRKDDLLCVTATDDGKGSFDVEVTNESTVWAAAFAAGELNSAPRLAGVVTPSSFTLPSIDSIISALLKATTKVAVSSSVDLVCSGAGWVGLDCPEKWIDMFSPADFFNEIRDEINPSKQGKAGFALAEAEATNNIAFVTPGFRDLPSGYYPREFDPVIDGYTRPTLVTVSIYSSVVEPMLALFLGDSLDDLGDSSGNSAGGTDVVKALMESMAKSDNLATTANAALTGFESGDLTKVKRPRFSAGPIRGAALG